MEVPQQAHYLQYKREAWTGISHQLYNLSVLLAEAAFLQRVAVLPDLTLASHHNGGRAMRVPLSTYFDLSVFQSEACFITKEEFEQLQLPEHELVDEKTPPQQLQRKSTPLIIREFTNPDAIFSAPMKSEPEVEKIACKIRSLIAPSQSIRHQAEEIVKALGEDFDTVHVRRGDLLEQAKREWWRFPGYEQYTSPKGIRKRIAQWVGQGRTLYVMTDEGKPGFFDPLKTWYKVYTFRDFQALEALYLTDNYLLYEIEKCIASKARIQVEMFSAYGQNMNFTYSLLSYPRWGVNTRFSRALERLSHLIRRLKRILKGSIQGQSINTTD
ncbi:MAG: hypothetical protein HY785_07100 [Oscillatoriophycideae cyanobacterium NC_groundwater_1537_Pr4_S-0.65um_50_18]|nr:hypothetical protein [Oscillatoriophycideae cyanobacterium NC_groundwater_1537_Pr4_S-0.65um_50_18]